MCGCVRARVCVFAICASNPLYLKFAIKSSVPPQKLLSYRIVLINLNNKSAILEIILISGKFVYQNISYNRNLIFSKIGETYFPVI